MNIHIKEYDSGWIEIYINGELKYENHSISPTKLLLLIGVNYTSEHIEDDEDD